ncbi:unnamed protein product [Adineta steineri]|uniref:Ubiquitin thioesterase OTU n=1 Tax=Adineta steineri TaxID=433720 RepID=A0A819Z6W8_9BILA|nr:unnamed protein product [Adineta steineri]
MYSEARISALSHEFHRGQVPVDSSSLLSSIRYINDTSETITNETIRNFVADNIFKNENLHTAILKRQINCTDAKEYHKQFRKDQLRDGEIEIQALSNICRVLIGVVSMKKNDQGSINVKISKYGDDIQQFDECVYILYNEDAEHYDPLYIVNKANQDEKVTIFERDNTETLDLLRTFIQEKLHAVDIKELDCCIPSRTTEPPTKIKDLIDDERLMGMITPMAAERSSPIERNDRSKNTTMDNRSCATKRRYRNFDELTYGQRTKQELSSNQTNDRGAKYAKVDTNEFLESVKTNSEFLTFEELFQTDFVASEFEPQIEQQLTTDSPATLNQPTNMRLEVDIAEGHRGRTRGDFIPKKPFKPNGEPSELGPPRYFSDENGKTYLNLLILERILSGTLHQIYLEVGIITIEKDGYAYINPYFKLMVAPNDRLSPLLNPAYMLRLVVVTLTNRELMKAKQPLTIFSSSETDNGQKAITTRFKTHDEFKNAYDLHQMRFAITLWTKQHGEKEFRRREDIQYISSISIEDRKYTKS